MDFLKRKLFILLPIALSGCANEQMKDPFFQDLLVREVERQISSTQNSVDQQKERNAHLRELLASITSEQSRLRSMIVEKKALLERLEKNSLEQ